MTSPLTKPVGRRQLMQGAAAGLISAPFVRRAAASERSLKISTYGGNFENGFKKGVFPAFTAATGIAVESLPQPADLSFLMQITEANRAGRAPIDLCTFSQGDIARANKSDILRPYREDRLKHAMALDPRYLKRDKAGLVGVGAMGWYQTLVINPDEVKPTPTSWRVLWDPAHKAAWGLAGGGNTTLFEITATAWFDGIAMLDTKEGILQVVAKMRDLRPNTKLWWESEGTMQTAYENDEVIGGMYFHDVAGQMAKSGTPILSIFPKEGGVLDFGCWCQPSASTKIDEAEIFIDFMATPEAQALMVRKTGTAPVIDRKLTDLTDAEFAAVSSDTPPIMIAVEARSRLLDFMDASFNEMLKS